LQLLIVILQNEANFITSFQWFCLPRAVVEGAALVGEDGKGKNGLAGYFKRLARHYPQAMGNWLGKLWPWPDEDSEDEPKRPIEEVLAAGSAFRDEE
jgi:hypothetical protein